MTCRWAVALAVLTGAPACTPIETVYVPHETGHRYAGCDGLEGHPPGTIDAAGKLRGRPRAGTCPLVHKTSRFQAFAAKLPRCPVGQTGVAIDRLGGGADREVSVRGTLTYDQTAPSCEVNGEMCECCRDCSLPLVLADPRIDGVSRAAPVRLMERATMLRCR